MATRSRVVTFGMAGLLVVAGALCGALVAGTVGQVLAFVLISLGLVLAVALVFFEVGLSEDRERAREERRQRRRSQPRPRQRLARMRGQSRRLK